MNKKKKELVLVVLVLLSLLVITFSVTYAFFNYVKEGATDNIIKTGTITFVYEEVSALGAGISINDAYPISDDLGKSQFGSGKVFDFKIKSTTISDSSIPYTITARMKSDSDLPQNAVKLYLTQVDVNNSETALMEKTFDNLGQIDNAPDGVVEKLLYSDIVPKQSTNYEKNYRLRMWIPSTINFSPVNQDGVDVYPYNNKKFTINVNVYANAEVVTQTTDNN